MDSYKPPTVDLIDQILEMAKKEDEELFYFRRPNWDKTKPPFGEGPVIFHLRVLRELLLEEDKRLGNIIDTNDHRPETPKAPKPPEKPKLYISRQTRGNDTGVTPEDAHSEAWLSALDPSLAKTYQIFFV